MIKEHESVHEMLNNYLETLAESIKKEDIEYTSWHFSNNEEIANSLAELVKDGVKRGTTSLYYWYGLEGEELPKEGQLSIITDWKGIAQCIIEIKKVNIMPFKEVTEEFAKIEGEGDKSLEYWRRVHIDFFTKELSEVGKEFTEDMEVVFEEFEVVYK
ncbi:ASCH domain-containing protein [Wukongibacter baidiensis]|uniref:ASCH domain-containing protein n=1 Tax=Wukongibacter baidiensis TaxID=1723361 RepID=UPI003D7F76CA